MMNSFWWGRNLDNSKCMNWLSWDHLSMDKKYGGMGFKNLSAFNYAMVGKETWNLMSKPNNRVSRLYKARYFPNSDFLDSVLGHNPSYVWRSIWSSKFVVRGSYKWSIGSSESISIWNQNWLHDRTSLTNPWSHIPDVSNMKVVDLISNHGKQWNSDLIVPLVGEEVANKILNTALSEMVQVDKMVRNFERGGNYSMRSAYRFCINEAIDTSHLRIDGNWDLIWKLKTLPRMKNFL
ncbi:unnamed protein product [Lathyrus sativus]|nr:unnamed protein product [Lathyrus sativus]